MNDHDRTSRQLAAGLVDLAGTSAPDYRNDILGRVARTRQRPAWTFPERWIPMALVTHRTRTAPPLRSAWTLLLIGLLTLALVASLVIAGSMLLRQRPDDQLQGTVMVPTLEADATWDATAIEGLSIPVGMDIGPDGNLYVVNAGTSEVLVLDPDGRVLRRWGTPGTGPGQFDFIRVPSAPQDESWGGVTVAPDGSSVYVSDPVNDRVQQFDVTGRFVRQWGRYGPAEGEFFEPWDVAAAPDGTIYVVDDDSNDIQRFSADGTYLETIGGPGAGHGQMSNTGSIFVDAAGIVYNADWGNSRVQAWDRDGEFLWSLGGLGTTPGRFTQPIDVGLDDQGNMYVTDKTRVQVFDPARTPVSSWVAPTSDSSLGTRRCRRLCPRGCICEQAG